MNEEKAEYGQKPEQMRLDMGPEPAADASEARPLPAACQGRPEMVRVAPGKHGWLPAESCHPEQVPQYCLSRWARQPDGSYAPIPFPYRMVRLTPETTAQLGFVSGNRKVRYDTILRLGRAGFVELIRVSPNCWLIDLDSWFAHLGACMDDPDYWDEGGPAREQYNLANGLGVDHGR